MTSLLVLTSACLVVTQALHVHVHRVSRASNIQVTDPLHSYSLALRGDPADDLDSVLNKVMLHKIVGTRTKRTTDDKKTEYKSGQDGGLTAKLNSDSEEVGPRYGVLLDAGSSSTKVKVYTHIPGVLPSLVPHVELMDSVRIKPGLDDYVTKPQHLAEYLQSAVEKAVSHVPKHLHNVTPVYVWATAGLRTFEADAAKTLLKEVQTCMANRTISPFYFRPRHVSILSGEEEAVYAWIAVNYLRGFFDTNMTQANSAGVIEMGGGSLQIAFMPDGPLYQEEFQVYVGRTRFDLYAQSYLNFGSSYLTQHVRQQLFKNAQAEDTELPIKKLDSPCMLIGDTGKLPGNIKVTGTGDPPQCERVLAQLLQPFSDSSMCSPTPCGIGDRYQPAVGSMVFYGISALLFAPENMGAIEDDLTLNITKLRHNAWKHCNRTLERAQNVSGANPNFASNDCLVGLFIPLLLKSFGFRADDSHIILAKNIGNERIDWALGAMLQQLSMAFMDDLDLHRSAPCPHGDLTELPGGLVAGSATGGADTQRLSLTLTYFGLVYILVLTVKSVI